MTLYKKIKESMKIFPAKMAGNIFDDITEIVTDLPEVRICKTQNGKWLYCCNDGNAICDMFWGWKWYPLIYFLTGAPLFVLTVLVSWLISMKENEHISDAHPMRKNWYDILSGGRYYSVRPSFYRRVSCWIKLKFFGEQSNLSEESAFSTVAVVISGREEKVVNLGQIRAWEWKEEGIRLNYAEKEKQIRVSFEKDADVRLLNRGENCKRDKTYVFYLA